MKNVVTAFSGGGLDELDSNCGFYAMINFVSHYQDVYAQYFQAQSNRGCGKPNVVCSERLLSNLDSEAGGMKPIITMRPSMFGSLSSGVFPVPRTIRIGVSALSIMAAPPKLAELNDPD
jgi:hypothetical protein